MSYKPAKRNYERVQHEKIRKEIDEYFGKLHDDISKAWYDKEEFIWEGHNFGVPSKEMFDDFHKFSNDARLLAFHFINKRLENDTVETKIGEDEYRYSYERDEKGEILSTTDLVKQAKQYIEDILTKYPNFDIVFRHSKYGEYSLREAKDLVNV